MPHGRKLLPFASSAAFASTDARSFAQQESLLIALNLFALTALLLVQTLFRNVTDPASFELVVSLFLFRIAEQLAESAYLRRFGSQLAPLAVFWYARASILVNILFAGILSLSANSVDAHYSVLLILPLIAAGFRLALPGVLLVVGVTGGLAFLETWVYFLRNPPVDVEEFFEAATMVLVYMVVGFVVWGLARNMRRNEKHLEATILELRETRDRLVEEEKLAAVGRLASAIAHEIRNPVSMIMSALETARKAGATAELQQEFSAIAAKEADRLSKVTTEFLSYARTKPPERQPCSAREMLDYVAGLLRARAAEAGPQIQVDCSPDLTLMLDQFQIHQALINLGLNALEHTTSGGRVLLGAVSHGAGAELYVENDGPPVPEKHGLDIFEPFVTTRPSGTGLGLSISRNIARAHGGDLLLTRNLPGAVRFTLRFPKE